MHLEFGLCVALMMYNVDGCVIPSLYRIWVSPVFPKVESRPAVAAAAVGSASAASCQFQQDLLVREYLEPSKVK